MNNQIFNYDFNGVSIPFEAVLGNPNVMVNATEMAKACCSSKEEYNRKRPNRWLELDSTKEFIQELLNAGLDGIKNINDVVYSVNGRYGGGTWMEKHAAIQYAQWVKPGFAIWVSIKIDEILSTGYSFMESEYNKVLQDNQQLQSMLNSLQPKVTYYDQVLQNQDFKYTLKDICNNLSLKISYKDLANRLVNDGYAYRSKGLIYLKEPYASENYLGSTTILCPDGNYRVQMLWSEGGRSWIHSLACKWRVV